MISILVLPQDGERETVRGALEREGMCGAVAKRGTLYVGKREMVVKEAVDS